ncbi:MAG TPA: glycoside hydrolase domain-containing protein [Streptosporangiaceae bacterium]|nr:glycoside hydrolase domain-containing protein [Streptosporangiaceae bacterium]
MRFRSCTAILAGLVICGGLARSGAPVTASSHRWQSVTFEGVSLRVPASWPVIDLRRRPSACPRLDVHAVYLGTPGPDPVCPAGLLGRTEAVMIGPIRPGSTDLQGATERVRARGRLVLTNPDWAVSRTMTEILPGAGVEVLLTYRANRALARTIASSIRVGPAARPVPLRRLAPIAAGPPQGIFTGSGFDACAAPSAATMTRWLASKYRAIGIYIGGVNRACSQASLTPSWLAAIQGQGWHYFPIYPGLQSSCVQAFGDATIDSRHAAAEGTAAADDAAVQAASLGIPLGTPLIYDMEAYSPACDSQVTTFLSAWDSELHARGFSAGVYESFSNIGALVSAAGSMTEPDVIYYADWDGVPTTTSSYMPAGLWTTHQRLHQYLGGHLESHGGVSLNIDNDQLDVNLGGKPGPGGHAGFRIPVAINANGTAEWFARSASGTLVHAWQQPVGSLTWSTVHTVGDSPAIMTSNPSAAAQADGRLTVFADDTSGRVQHAWQQAGFPNGWEWGTPLAAPPGHDLAGTDPAAVRLPGGDVEVYQTTASGTVTTIRQLMRNDNAGWTAWRNIKGSCAGSPVPVVDGGRHVDVFCVTAAGSAAMDTWNGSSWSGWSVVAGSPAGLTGVPAVAVNGSGQTELFAATSAGGLDDAWQNATTGAWTWGQPLAGPGTGTTIAGWPAAATWSAGQLAVYAQVGGQLKYVTQQTASGQAPWTSWSVVGGVPGGGMLGNPAAWLNTSGVPGVAVLDGGLRLANSSYVAGAWAAWTEQGGSF